MFAKIFRQIYESSIAEKPDLRFTFMDMCVLADMNGVVDMTHEAIARTTNRPIEVIRATILELEAPDPKSRTPDENGARIKRLDEHRDWGWLIINYHNFRRITTEDQRREKTLARVRKYREKKKQTGDAPPSHSPPADLSVELPPNFPTTEQAAITACIEDCIPDDFVKKVWNLARGRGGRDSKEVLIRSWPHHCKTCWIFEQERQAKEKEVAAAGGKLSPSLLTQFKAIEAEIDKHPANKESVYYNGNPTKEQKAELKEFKKKKDELNRLLAGA